MLRNAFDMLATEGTLRQLLRQLSFAKTPTDAMRVNVENSLSVTSISAAPVFAGNSNNTMVNAVNQPAHWGSVSWNSVDARYQYGEQLIGNYIQNRERWVIS